MVGHWGYAAQSHRRLLDDPIGYSQQKGAAPEAGHHVLPGSAGAATVSRLVQVRRVVSGQQIVSVDRVEASGLYMNRSAFRCISNTTPSRNTESGLVPFFLTSVHIDGIYYCYQQFSVWNIILFQQNEVDFHHQVNITVNNNYCINRPSASNAQILIDTSQYFCIYDIINPRRACARGLR